MAEDNGGSDLCRGDVLSHRTRQSLFFDNLGLENGTGVRFVRHQPPTTPSIFSFSFGALFLQRRSLLRLLVLSAKKAGTNVCPC